MKAHLAQSWKQYPKQAVGVVMEAEIQETEVLGSQKKNHQRETISCQAEEVAVETSRRLAGTQRLVAKVANLVDFGQENHPFYFILCWFQRLSIKVACYAVKSICILTLHIIIVIC